jgi:hypothetical protein
MRTLGRVCLPAVRGFENAWRRRCGPRLPGISYAGHPGDSAPVDHELTFSLNHPMGADLKGQAVFSWFCIAAMTAVPFTVRL